MSGLFSNVFLVPHNCSTFAVKFGAHESSILLISISSFFPLLICLFHFFCSAAAREHARRLKGCASGRSVLAARRYRCLSCVVAWWLPKLLLARWRSGACLLRLIFAREGRDAACCAIIDSHVSLPLSETTRRSEIATPRTCSAPQDQLQCSRFV